MSCTVAAYSHSQTGPSRWLRERLLGSSDRDRWNSFVAAWPSFGGLQSFEWGEFKQQLGWEVFRIAIESGDRILAGAQVMVKRLPLGLASIAYIPRGPLVDWQNAAVAVALLQAIHAILREHRCLFLRIEPPLLDSAQTHRLLRQYGFRPTRQTNQPRCTLLIDLEPELETLFARLPKKTRHQIRFASRCGVAVRPGDEKDLAAFYRLLRETSSRAGFSPRERQYYELQFKAHTRCNRAVLLIAECGGRPIGAEMAFAFGAHGAALHGASSSDSRHLRVSDLLTWEGIKWAKSQGCRTYDLWGIPEEVGELRKEGKPVPQNMQGGLWGVYYFKRRFGGDVLYYVGAYDHVYVKSAYAGATSALSWLESAKAIARLINRRLATRHST